MFSFTPQPLYLPSESKRHFIKMRCNYVCTTLCLFELAQYLALSQRNNDKILTAEIFVLRNLHYKRLSIRCCIDRVLYRYGKLVLPVCFAYIVEAGIPKLCVTLRRISSGFENSWRYIKLQSFAYIFRYGRGRRRVRSMVAVFQHHVFRGK
jgi:hypothetical protein